MIKIIKIKTVNYQAIVILVTTFLMLTSIGELNAQEIDSSNPINRYSFNLYHKAKVENENLFLSPLSTYYALLSAYEGSKNQTKMEFENVLGLKNSEFSKNDIFYLPGITDSLSGLSISNAVWVDNNFKIENTYKKAVSNKLKSNFKQIDFSKTEQAVTDINHWVSSKTNNRIKDMVGASDLNSETKLMITNATYFKGEWLKPFNESATHKNVFFADSINHYRADFMNKTEKLAYFENEAFQFVAKPYKQSSLSFGIILPKDFFGLEAVENQLKENLFNEVLENADTTNVLLSMPKIKLESKLKLKPVLKRMGLETMFTNEADFSGISPNDSLHFEEVMHKTHINLNEEYTEAAAATTTNVYITGMPSYETFKADHPFVFFIVDNKTKTLVFMGRYVKPQEGEKIDRAYFARNLERREIIDSGWNSGKEPLLLVAEGNELKEIKIDDVDFDNIDSLKVYTKKEDIERYTNEDYYDGIGVIVITPKKNKKSTK